MAEKGTTMVLNVDLRCSKCYKKVKKLLCKFPEIRDQEYNEKANKVTIKVVCCSPEKIRDKLCCKGGGCIKSIEIKESKPSRPPPKDQPVKQQPPPKDQPGKHQPPPKDQPVKQQPPVKDQPVKQQISIDLELGLHLQGRPVPPPPQNIPQIPLGFVVVNATVEGLGVHVPVASESNTICVMGDPFTTAGAAMEAAVVTLVKKINKAAQSCKY